MKRGMICVRCEQPTELAEGVEVPGRTWRVRQIIFDAHPAGMALCTDCATPSELEERMRPVLERVAREPSYKVPGPGDQTVVF